MRIHNHSLMMLSWLVSKPVDELRATFVVKGTFDLVAQGVATAVPKGIPPAGDIPHPESPDQSLYYDSDLVPLKRRTDVLLVGSCHTPGSKPLPACHVEFHVGSWKKVLAVIGDRTWSNGFIFSTMSSAAPFTKMPVKYDLAFGGEAFKKNPVGTGCGTARLPNIEDPERLILSPSDRPDPAGFGPVHSSWPQRAGKQARISRSYLKERWPWYPEDFDWDVFNAAPRDQQFDGYLRGDEPLRMVNLHPEHPVFECRLPGTLPQVFVRYKSGDEPRALHEVHLKLDTLWVDMDTCKLVLVWRGLAPVSHIKLEDVDEVHVVQRRLDETPFTPETYVAGLARREAEHKEAEAREAEAERQEQAADELEMAKAQAEMDELSKTIETEMAQRKEEAKALLIQQGLDPGSLDRPAAPPDFQKMVAELRAMIAASPNPDPKLAQAVDALEANPPVLPEPEAEPEPWTRDRFLSHIQAGKSFEEEDLSGVDLPGIDLSGLDLSGIEMAKANLSSAKLCKTSFKGADLSGANLAGADLAGANISGADLSGANLEGAILREANLDRAALCDTMLAGAILDGTSGNIADFSGANLTGASFCGSRLTQPDFSECRLERAVFRQAVIPNATFARCQGAGIVMESAEMQGMRAGNAPDFTGGNFQRLKADRSFWAGARLDGAIFQYASLARADFTGASLRGARLGGANLTGATFEDGTLEQASLAFANLLKGSFERTNLSGCDLRDANCYEAEFWDAKLDKTLLEGTNLTMTKLENR